MSRCVNCINSTGNPSRTFDSEGVCNVCNEYSRRFSREKLKDEFDFIQHLVQNNDKINCLAAVSGGKDSIAMLKTICDFGFHPLAFTFDAGYNPITDQTRRAISNAVNVLGIPHEYIDARPYLSEADRMSFFLTADLYDNRIENMKPETVQMLFAEERFHNSPKCQSIRPFVRPCRLCRRFIIRGYYAEAVKRNISVVFLGINEWCGIHNSSYSAVRKLEPVDGQPVFIVHLPFLVQRKLSDLTPILDTLGWTKENTVQVQTGSSNCTLARIAESKSTGKLGFNPDEPRLAREVTVGYMTREQALSSIEEKAEPCDLNMRTVLTKGGVINDQSVDQHSFWMELDMC